MLKKSYTSVNLDCLYQQSEEPVQLGCLNGLFSQKSNGHFIFEETVRKTRDVRNAKLYEGSHFSMVRMKNGKYQLHSHVFSADELTDELRSQICEDIMKAFANIL